jgi:hypothetical protein
LNPPESFYAWQSPGTHVALGRGWTAAGSLRFGFSNVSSAFHAHASERVVVAPSDHHINSKQSHAGFECRVVRNAH